MSKAGLEISYSYFIDKIQDSTVLLLSFATESLMEAVSSMFTAEVCAQQMVK